jgi:hypothetical protein
MERRTVSLNRTANLLRPVDFDRIADTIARSPLKQDRQPDIVVAFYRREYECRCRRKYDTHNDGKTRGQWVVLWGSAVACDAVKLPAKTTRVFFNDVVTCRYCGARQVIP